MIVCDKPALPQTVKPLSFAILFYFHSFGATLPVRISAEIEIKIRWIRRGIAFFPYGIKFYPSVCSCSHIADHLAIGIYDFIRFVCRPTRECIPLVNKYVLP